MIPQLLARQNPLIASLRNLHSAADQQGHHISASEDRGRARRGRRRAISRGHEAELVPQAALVGHYHDSDAEQGQGGG